MPKVDLHTHSVASTDGGLTAIQYQKVLDGGKLDAVAITDHNRIDFATFMHEQLGDLIIIGEEIMTLQGEIVGLYLTKPIQPHLTAGQTMSQIKDQGGLVYIPHPFETVRKALDPASMEELQDQIDIIEVCNGRVFAQNRARRAIVWSKLNHVPGAASSDAHGWHGIGKTFTDIASLPTRENLVELLKSGVPVTDRPSLRALLYPNYHRFRRRLGGSVYE